jgi:hypothetical protein
MRGEQALNESTIAARTTQAGRREPRRGNPALEQQPMAAALPDEFRCVGQERIQTASGLYAALMKAW